MTRLLVLVWLAALLRPASAQPSDGVLVETRVDQVRAEYGLAGAGVVVAVLDRGLDVEHPAFRRADGTTRVLGLLDLTDDSGATAPDNPVGVGTVYGPYASPATNGGTSAAVPPGAGFAYYHRGTAVDFYGAASPRREILIDLMGPVGTWTIRLTGETVAAGGRFDALLNPSNLYSHPQNRFLTFAEPGYTVWKLAASPLNLPLNSYILNPTWVDVDGVTRTYPGNDAGAGALWPGSGIGPTYDGRLGMSVSAPGQANFKAYAPRSVFALSRASLVVDGPAPYGVLGFVSGAGGGPRAVGGAQPGARLGDADAGARHAGAGRGDRARRAGPTRGHVARGAVVGGHAHVRAGRCPSGAGRLCRPCRGQRGGGGAAVHPRPVAARGTDLPREGARGASGVVVESRRPASGASAS